MAKDPIKALWELEKRIEARVARVINKNVTRVRDRLRAQQILRTRTKGLPWVRKKAHLVGTLMAGWVFSPASWGAVHIGPRGTAVTITPKRGQFLALPTDFVKTYQGHPVGPRQYGGTAVFGGIIWGRAGWGGARTGGGLRQRRAAGEKLGKQTLVPLYILKKSIVVRRRIDPAEMVQWIKPQFLADLKKEVLKVP